MQHRTHSEAACMQHRTHSLTRKAAYAGGQPKPPLLFSSSFRKTSEDSCTCPSILVRTGLRRRRPVDPQCLKSEGRCIRHRRRRIHKNRCHICWRQHDYRSPHGRPWWRSYRSPHGRRRSRWRSCPSPHGRRWSRCRWRSLSHRTRMHRRRNRRRGCQGSPRSSRRNRSGGSGLLKRIKAKTFLCITRTCNRLGNMQTCNFLSWRSFCSRSSACMYR